VHQLTSTARSTKSNARELADGLQPAAEGGGLVSGDAEVCYWKERLDMSLNFTVRIPFSTKHIGCPLAASFSAAAVEQEQRIGFDRLGRVPSPQRVFRGFDRRPYPLRRVVG
jgi:hypothetical protein